ncbi:sigma-54-dependent Fis family transcriptional regulator [Ramlibacter henchirensis]|uniref:Sigma-54-dependent Fis family transcriptional regulator n=1 Tax=Ramlibacter henchirensis TaxID=204072 RepID=A0A4Z0C8T9_9BURK|nr:sigma-54 dependent transcriptional regulator [Ramlibacter henchirensis]TFZ06505.1 sigma-54-dependent Fis family transcriptional regulator [Ramlibacter henchirensis]
MNAPAAAPVAQVLVVDDEPDLRTLYELTLLREGYHVDSAATLADAFQHLEERRFDAVITDMRLPDGQGLELLLRMGAQQRSERCIVMTAYGSAENAVEALKAGAFDYLTKPVDLKQFRSVVASAIQDRSSGSRARAAGNGRSEKAASTGQSALDRLVGNSAPMQQVKERIAKVARSMAPVLVRGESGTGKELAARALHACSHRSDGPFVAVNCSAIPEALLEAEFFGARKGSYTGSTADREGYFQAASGGTLFLDEIGDLPLAMQSKLLRAIQERHVRALGSTQEDSVDVRIVSATHRDLAADVAAGKFRQDLYYRLNVIEILVPPLRERREDLPALCEALLARIASETGMPVPTLSSAVAEQLACHPLAGNVRELENLLHRAVALSDGEALQVDEAATAPAPLPPQAAAPAAMPVFTPAPITVLPPPVAGAAVTADPAALQAALLPTPKDLQAWLDQQEREILVRTLQETGFNRTAAAQRLGLSLRQIRYRIARLAIAVPGGEEPNETAA